MKGGSNEALISYYDDPKTKQTVIQVQLYGGPTSKDLVLQIEKKLLSSYPKLEQYDRQEIPTPQFFNLNFKVKEKTTAKGGLAGNTRLKQEPMEEEKKGHYVTVKAKDGSHKSTLTNLPNHADQTYSDALRSIERLKAVDGRKGKKYIYYVSDKDGNPVSNPSGITEEDILREADEIVAAWAEKQTLNEEMHGGYLELLEMNPNFEEGVAKLLQAWNEWAEGDMTEPYMIEEAKHDILAYLSSMMK